MLMTGEGRNEESYQSVTLTCLSTGQWSRPPPKCSGNTVCVCVCVHKCDTYMHACMYVCIYDMDVHIFIASVYVLLTVVRCQL